MKILAVDTSSKNCGVTILEDNNVLINLNNNDEKTHSVKLMPMIDEAFSKTSLSLDDIGLIVCCIGPGSFTGVRIGISTVKAFADVKNIPVVGVTSLESLAYNIKDNVDDDTIICSLIDAKNNNVYCSVYFNNSNSSINNNKINNNTININKFMNSINTKISIFTDSIDNSIEKINERIKEKINEEIAKGTRVENSFPKLAFVGDASAIYKEQILSAFPEAIFAEDEQNLQSAVSLGKAGLVKYLSGEYGNSSSISPIYLRKSQAERALEEKIEILPMSLEDIDAIAPNFSENFDEFWNINNLKSDFENPNSTYFVAKLDNEIVGFAGFLKICDEANIMNIVTKKEKRHIGIGEKLLNSIISSAKAQNLKSITLEVNEKNYPAIKLYEKFNFKRIGLRKKYYNNTDDAILMTYVVFGDRR